MVWHVGTDRILPVAGAQNDELIFTDFCRCICGRVVEKVGVVGQIMGGEGQGVTDYVFR